MRGSFFGLNISVNGLNAAQRNLELINHNITNASTPGYSRQVAVQTAGRAIPMLDGTGMMGTGAVVTSVNSVRDDFLDFKYWSETVSGAEYEAKSQLLQEIEATFNEPSMAGTKGSGFTAVINDFFTSLSELSKNPSDMSVRAVVKERGVTLSTYFKNTYQHFNKLREDVNFRIRTKVGEINSLAKQVKDLNRDIFAVEVGGDQANDLRDQRALIVDKLSKLANVEVYEVAVGKTQNGKDENHFIVNLNGRPIVEHVSSNGLKCVPDAGFLDTGIPKLDKVIWEDGNKLVLKKGELKGYLDVRDGTGVQGGAEYTEYKGIPFYLKSLNTFADTFAKEINDLHDNGLDYHGGAGGQFFSCTGTADTLNVDSAIMNDLTKIAAASLTGGKGNAENINKMLGLRHKILDFDASNKGTLEDFMKSLVSNLGIDTQYADRIAKNQQMIVKQIENSRLSVSGVSLDEEMANMVKHQHCYNACAKMISTMSQVYDTLINRLGVG